MSDPLSIVTQVWNAGVAAVSGRRSVAQALEQDGSFAASMVIAVGKASCSMYQGAQACISSSTRSIVVSKYGHFDPAFLSNSKAEIIEAGHPIPDENSVFAGEAIVRFVSDTEPADQLLLLVSGGASTLAEALRPEHSLSELQAVNRSLLGSGKTIGEMNKVRTQMSRIKGGRLLGYFRGREVRVYALSDVQGDGLAVIGSGIGDPCRTPAKVQAHVVGSNSVARNAAAVTAGKLGFCVRLNEESLYKDVSTLAGEISARLEAGPAGIYIWGGEPTIELPANPGTGGRNQSLALAVATYIRGKDGISLLVAGTDGTDGPTAYAGAYVDGNTVNDLDKALEALRNANAGEYLGRRNCLFKPGPTDTNVMDLVIAVVS